MKQYPLRLSYYGGLRHLNNAGFCYIFALYYLLSIYTYALQVICSIDLFFNTLKTNFLTYLLQWRIQSDPRAGT